MIKNFFWWLFGKRKVKKEHDNKVSVAQIFIPADLPSNLPDSMKKYYGKDRHSLSSKERDRLLLGKWQDEHSEQALLFPEPELDDEILDFRHLVKFASEDRGVIETETEPTFRYVPQYPLHCADEPTPSPASSWEPSASAGSSSADSGASSGYDSSPSVGVTFNG